jgi:uncharacterized membrane protein
LFNKSSFLALKKPLPSGKFLPYLLTIGGAIGFLASFVLTLDTMSILSNPDFVPNCNINPVLSCGSVMKTEQATVFGFANSLIGVGAFAAVSGLGIALLAGATLRRWLWLAIYGGVSLGFMFVHWLIFESLYKIGSLCPYCMVVWVVTIAIFWSLTSFNLRQSHLAGNKLSVFINKYQVEISVVWLLIIIGLILERFWYYWSTLL